ncbi:unnamed protein product, partial [Ectocarpus sp. 12 AP-2014]
MLSRVLPTAPPVPNHVSSVTKKRNVRATAVVVVILVFTLKTVPVSAQNLTMSVLVQLTPMPSVVTSHEDQSYRRGCRQPQPRAYGLDGRGSDRLAWCLHSTR